MAIVAEAYDFVIGIDTHARNHTYAALQDSECKRGLNPPVSSNDRAI